MKRLIAILSGTSLALMSNLFPAHVSNAQTELTGSESTISARMHTACLVTDLGSVRCWGKNEAKFNQIPADMGRVTQVSVGEEHVCALNEQGYVKCWGSNSQGQTNVPVDLGQVRQISTGGVHTCVITIAGYARCWGYSGEGRTSPPSNKVTQLSSSNSHACAVTELGKVICWGSNEYGARTVPSNLGYVSRVAAGDRYSCAITYDENLKCWGWDWYGSVPGDLGKVKSVDIDSLHVCAIKTNGDLKCWTAGGYDTNIPTTLGKVAQVADGLEFTCAVSIMQIVKCWGSNQHNKTVVPGQAGRAVEIASGFGHTCVLTEIGQVRCWGDQDMGQSSVPDEIADATSISAGQVVTCAITSAGNVKCWGWDGFGQLAVPDSLGEVSKISVGFNNTCVITKLNALTCWGSDDGINDVPEDIGQVGAVSVGKDHACATSQLGAVRCWGSNQFGQITIPESLGYVQQVKAGSYHNCALKASGSVECWGSNTFGSSLHNQSNVPTDLNSVSKIAAGVAHNCALLEVGTVRCWGRNVEGQANVPADLERVDQLSASEIATCAITVPYSIKCWGDNSYGQGDIPIDIGEQITVLAVTADLPATSPPVVQGIPLVGSLLSVEEPDWLSDTLYTYTWYRDNVEIGGAESRVHRLVEDDYGKEVSVAIRGFKSGFNSIIRFSSSVTVSKVQLTGVPSLGGTLLASPGSWADNDEYVYQWFMDDSPVANATESEYKLRFEDLGKFASVKIGGFKNGVPVSNLQSNSVQVSLDVSNTFCKAAIDPSGWKENKQTTPVISGEPRFGQTLTGLTGNWTIANKCSYWLKSGIAIPAADSPTYKIQSQDIGSEIQYVVVGSDKQGGSFLRYSDPVLIKNNIFIKVTAPTLSGEMRVGMKLTGTVESWMAGTVYAFQWFRGGTAIAGSNSSSYVLSPDDLGKRISLRVCGSKSYFDSLCLTSSAKSSVSLGVISAQPKASIIAKSTKIGSTLTGKTGSWGSGVFLQSQWLANGKPIKGSSNKLTYKIKPTDKGKTIAFQVTASKNGFKSATISSAGTNIR
jgi:alpha-tubulin suppressor-like RCC1 family protein